MQNLSKPELLSVLDFIFAIKKINDSTSLYKTMQKLAREALRCDELIIGTCSQGGSSNGCDLSLASDGEFGGEPDDFHDGAAPARQMPCKSACASSGAGRGAESPATDITTTDDGIMV
jgi:hypothetical protein